MLWSGGGGHEDQDRQNLREINRHDSRAGFLIVAPRSKPVRAKG